MKHVFTWLIFFLIFSHVEGRALIIHNDSVQISGIPRSLTWEIKPRKFIQGKNSITIFSGEKTDMFRDPNVTYNTDNAPKLLFKSDSNFVFTAAIHHDFISKWDG